jgi:hypothetical protein
VTIARPLNAVPRSLEMKKSCDELMTLGDSTAFDPVPDKRGNRPIEVLELDLSGFATNQELTGDSAIFLLLLIESHEIRNRYTT